MICSNCKTDTNYRIEHQFVYQSEIYNTGGSDLEVVLGSCPKCSTPMIVLRRGESTEMDGLVELVKIQNEEVLYPR
jgi:hypothetical protein